MARTMRDVYVFSAGYGAVTMPKDFASYLLAIVIINLLMYFVFYIIMKVFVATFVALNLTIIISCKNGQFADTRSCSRMYMCK